MKSFKTLMLLAVAMLLGTAAYAQPARKYAGSTSLYSPEKPSVMPMQEIKKSVTRAEDEGEWTKLGTGRFRDDFITTFYIIDCLEFDVEIEESVANPGLYRIKSPYKNYPATSFYEIPEDIYMEIDATDPDHVFFKAYNTHFCFTEDDGRFLISSIAGYQMEHYGNMQQAIDDGECGTLRDGEITFPHATLLVRSEYDGDEQWRFANYNNGFRVKLPGAPDLDVAIGIQGLDENNGNKLNVNFTIGSGCEKVRVAMIPGDYTDDMYNGIVDGSIASTEITSSQVVQFDYTANGVYSFVAVPFIGNDAKKVTYITKQCDFLFDGWKSWGNCTYTESIICDCDVQFSGLDSDTYEVELQESVDNPGYYRLVDPYGLSYKYSSANTYDMSHKYYMEIDATDRSAVSIKRMDKGCGLNLGYGIMEIWSKADRELTDRGKSKYEVRQMGYFGRMQEGVITFPVESILIRFSDYRDDWYWGNQSGNFKVVLPQAAIEAGIKDLQADGSVSDGEKAYYTIDGVRVDASSLNKGVYVVRQNGETKKVVVRK